MWKNGLYRFFYSIVLPAIFGIVLFIVSIYTIFIPSFEKNSMDRKKEMIKELTNTVWSLLEDYAIQNKNQTITLEKAQQLAADKIEKIRYGNENKDYFWIIDLHPYMVMHPYRSDLIDSDVSEYEDSAGNKFFLDAVDIVQRNGEGYINYIWQWKDDSTRVEPKLSYVKGFSQWGWIVGTGIYLDDVKKEVSLLKKRLLKISLIISLIICLLIIYIIKQSYNIEVKRKDAEDKLQLSKQKYKMLVEASTEGTLMIIDKKVVFSNQKFNKMIGEPTLAEFSYKFDDFFEISWGEIEAKFNIPDKSISIETVLKYENRFIKNVIISVSKINLGQQEAYVIIVKDVTRQKQIELETENLSYELQTSLLLMNQPVNLFIKEIVHCDINTTIAEAARLKDKKNKTIIFISQNNKIIGAVNNNDFVNRVIAKNIDTSMPVTEIMSAPVLYLNEHTLVYEAMLLFKEYNISHLLVKSRNGEPLGAISFMDILSSQQNSLSYLIKKIEKVEEVIPLKDIYKIIPVHINALIESGAKTQNINRYITSISDAISKRIIELAIEKAGDTPCEFAFIALGSEGRMEQTLNTDQDNAIIIEDFDENNRPSILEYFNKLAKQINTNLDITGYRLCKGEVMAMNQNWTQPLQTWKDYFTDWIKNSSPKGILDASIFFDFRYIYGNQNLVFELRDYINQYITDKAVFFQHLAQSITKLKLPVNIFGNIILEGNTENPHNIDIKKILLPIISFVRLYALKNNIEETNTLARLNKLYSLDIFKEPLYNELKEAYNFLMLLRIKSQTHEILNDIQPNNLADINTLTRIEKTTLKKIFSEIAELNTKINFDFKGSL